MGIKQLDMSLGITSDYKVRDMVPWHDLPEKAQEFFDYVDPESRWDARFVKYKGEWWDVFEFTRLGSGGDFALAGWEGICSTSIGTAIMVKFEEEFGELYPVMGFYVTPISI